MTCVTLCPHIVQYIETLSHQDKMRAVLIKDEKGPVENLYVGEAPKPTLGMGDVLIKESLIRNLDTLVEVSF